jgi:pimeloyl-ACP methyl ester carboxylesterase
MRISRKLRWTLRGLYVLTAILVMSFGGLLAYRVYRQHKNVQAFAIDKSKGIQESMFIPVGGIEQYILIRGIDRNNPVVLFLHGGPGLATSPLYSWFIPWEKHFTMVQWDQRGAGKTYGRYGNKTPDLTANRIESDGIQLVEYLRAHLQTDNIILLGHSWGSSLGLKMIARRPDLFSAYVGTGQSIDGKAGDLFGYNWVLQRARDTGDIKTVEALKKIGAPPWKDSKSILDTRKWYAKYAPQKENPVKYMMRSIPASLFAPEMSLKDLLDNVKGSLFSLEVFASDLNTFDARKTSLSYGVPMYFLLGDLDYVTPVPLVQAFVKEISAPHKEVIILEGDGHNAIMTDPDRFLAVLVDRLGISGVK